MNCKRKSRRRFFLHMRSRTPPISSEFRGGGGLNIPTRPSVRHWKVYRNQKTLFIFNQPPLPQNVAVYEIKWKKYGTAGQATDDNIIRRMRVVYWINKNHTTLTRSNITGFTHCLLKFVLELHFRIFHFRFLYEFME